METDNKRPGNDIIVKMVFSNATSVKQFMTSIETILDKFGEDKNFRAIFGHSKEEFDKFDGVKWYTDDFGYMMIKGYKIHTHVLNSDYEGMVMILAEMEPGPIKYRIYPERDIQLV